MHMISLNPLTLILIALLFLLLSFFSLSLISNLTLLFIDISFSPHIVSLSLSSPLSTHYRDTPQISVYDCRKTQDQRKAGGIICKSITLGFFCFLVPENVQVYHPPYLNQYIIQDPIRLSLTLSSRFPV